MRRLRELEQPLPLPANLLPVEPGPSNRPQRLDAAEAMRRLQELQQPLPFPANLRPVEPGPSNRPQQIDAAEARQRLRELEQPRVFDPVPYNPRRQAAIQDPNPHPDPGPPLHAAEATRRLRELEQPLPLPANLRPPELRPSNRPQQVDAADAMRRLRELDQPRVFQWVPYNPREQVANFPRPPDPDPDDAPHPDPQPDPDDDDPPPDLPVDPNNHALDPANLPRYFRPFDENDVEPLNLGRMDIPCPDCGALHWEAEKLAKSRGGIMRFGTCCLQGKVVLPPVQAPPMDLLHLYNGVSPHSEHFLKNIRRYNAAFALASLGVKVDRSVQDGHGPYVFKIHGALYHRVGALLPQPGRDPVYAQLYFYSTADANRYRLNRRENAAHGHMDGLDPQVMGILDTVLRENHAFVRQFKTAFERLRHQADQHPQAPAELRAVIRLERGTDPRRYNVPTADDVAVILPGDGSIVPDSRDLVLQYRHGGLKQIYETNAFY